MEDIKNIAGKIDLLVVTHQHEDHLSGFNLARQLFDQIPVDQVWMSWAEDPTDDVAVILKKTAGKKLAELKVKVAHASKQLAKGKSHSQNSSKLNDALQFRKKTLKNTKELLEFEEGRIHGMRLAAGSRTNEDAMAYTKKKGALTFKKPGDLIEDLIGAEGVKFYILGPPRDEDLKYIRIEMNEAEMYHLAASDSEDHRVTDTLWKTGVNLVQGRSPFDASFSMKGADLKKGFKEYNSPDYQWRQIEEDYLDTASDLAIALNRFVNNTSLAMALEFGATGKVMLLPADAQSGNWMSWHRPEVMNSFKAKGGKDTNDLLKATVFYKAGHHLSHNGTASVSGLDLMQGDLVSFAPLVQDKVPDQWGGAANFPAEKLYKVLISKTRGRLVRTDMGLVTDHNAPELRDQLSGSAKLDLKTNFKKGSCYFEYTVK